MILLEITNSQKKIIRPIQDQNIFKISIQINNTNYYKLLIVEDKNKIHLSKIENKKDSKSQDIDKNRENKKVRKACNKKMIIDSNKKITDQKYQKLLIVDKDKEIDLRYFY